MRQLLSLSVVVLLLVLMMAGCDTGTGIAQTDLLPRVQVLESKISTLEDKNTTLESEVASLNSRIDNISVKSFTFYTGEFNKFPTIGRHFGAVSLSTVTTELCGSNARPFAERYHSESGDAFGYEFWHLACVTTP
jgi:hypothetical protein